MTVKQALVVGAGIAGTTLAGELQSQGVGVDVVECEQEPTFRGIGIVLLPPTFRAIHQLGLADECVERGIGQYRFITCAADGTVLDANRMRSLVAPPYPPAVGIARPAFGEILRERAVSAGVRFQFGMTVDAIADGPDGIEVALADGTSRSYDVLIGADGLRSAIRSMVFPEQAPPVYIGQCGWRVRVGERPDEVDGQMLFLGETTRAGFNPILPNDMYIYLLHQTADARQRLTPEESHAQLTELLGEYGGLMAEMAQRLTPDHPSHYGPLYTSFISGDWHRGRVILIGDAAHATPPHLASGAGIAIEDAIVLARCLRDQDSVSSAFELFMRQRYERCRMVIENSRTLSRWDLEPDAPAMRAAELTTETFKVLSQPI